MNERRTDDGSRDRFDAKVAEVARVAARRTALRAATGYFLLVVVLFVGAHFYQLSVDHRLRTGLLAACERVNILRINEDNRNAQVVWGAVAQAAERERTLAATGGPQEEIHRHSSAAAQKLADAMRWTPRSDCRQAVDHPESYRPPRPMHFTHRFLDLRVVPG